MMGLRTDIRLEGIADARRALAAAKKLSTRKTLLRRLESAWDDTVLAIMGLAQQQAPVKTGTLRGSATSKSRFDGVRLTGEITFGGLASAYADVQHENEQFEHPKGGTDHWLYGRSHSAWEQSETGALQQLDRDAERMAEEEIGRA